MYISSGLLFTVLSAVSSAHGAVVDWRRAVTTGTGGTAVIPTAGPFSNTTSPTSPPTGGPLSNTDSLPTISTFSNTTSPSVVPVTPTKTETTTDINNVTLQTTTTNTGTNTGTVQTTLITDGSLPTNTTTAETPGPTNNTTLTGATTNATETGLSGIGVLPFPSATGLDTTTTGSNASPLTHSGSWSTTLPSASASMPWFLVPTTTIPPAQQTTEAVLLGVLFGNLRTNRGWITDNTLRSQYIDDVEKVQSETEALFNDLTEKPDTDCSSPSIGPNILADLVGDVGKLNSCAKDVVSNLVNAVKEPEPPIPEIESLTDVLAEIGTDLEKGDDPKTATTATNSQTSTTTTSSSCTGSTVVPICTETISFSTTVFTTGTLSTSSVSTISTTACSSVTVSGCASSSITTTTETGTPTASTLECAPTCTACVAAVPAATASTTDLSASQLPVISKRSQPTSAAKLQARDWLEPAEDDEGIDNGLTNLMNAPGSTQVEQPQSGFCSSKQMSFGNEYGAITLPGMFGCTSVIIVSEAGAWVSHLWEGMGYFTNPDDTVAFNSKVLDALQNGATETTGKVFMQSPLGLTQPGQIFAEGTNPQMFIFTPYDPENSGQQLYQAKIGRIQNLLSGPGAPFAGIPTTTQLYQKPVPVGSDDGTTALRYKARGKIALQYMPDNFADVMDDQGSNPQKALWRIYLESTRYEHEWTSTQGQQVAGECAGNQKRQNGGACTLTGAPTGSATGSNTAINTGTVMSPTIGTATGATTNGTATDTAVNTATATTNGTMTMDTGTMTGTSPTVTGTPSLPPQITVIPSLLPTLTFTTTTPHTVPTTTSQEAPATTVSEAPPPPAESCHTQYYGFFDGFTIYGTDWNTDLLDDGNPGSGDGLRKQLGGCGSISHYSYSYDPVANAPWDFKATGRTIIGEKSCIGHAIVSAGAPDDSTCNGSS